LTSISIAIVGAGIGGLAAAATLRRVGHEVAVYEQAHAFARIGAGIQQSPNAVKVLRHLGLEDRLGALAFRPGSSLNRAHDTGEITWERMLGAEVEAKYGAPYFYMHRGDLHEALRQRIPRICRWNGGVSRPGDRRGRRPFGRSGIVVGRGGATLYRPCRLPHHLSRVPDERCHY
jgi:glycine/D-amino acid oxidase-like deaminating enzyme